MYLYKRRKMWWVKYQVDGVVHRKSCHTQKAAEARAFVQAIESARRAPTFEDAVAILKMIYRQAPAAKIALADAWEIYERIARTVGKLSVTAKTVKDRRNHLAAFVRWCGETAATVKYVEDVTGRVAVLYAQHLADTGTKSKTRRNTITDLSTIWRILEKQSEAVRNPWMNLTPADTDGERGASFSRAQERDVLEAARAIGKDWYEVCMVARFTGLRYGDVAMLTWDSVGRDAIRLRPSKTERHGVEVVIPIVAELAAVLRSIPRRGDYLFPLHAEMYDQNGGKDIMKFREVLEAAGISGAGFSFHSWRHTFRTRLAEAGVDNEIAMRLCGHTQLKTSMRYDHAEHLEELRRAIEATAERKK